MCWPNPILKSEVSGVPVFKDNINIDFHGTLPSAAKHEDRPDPHLSTRQGPFPQRLLLANSEYLPPVPISYQASRRETVQIVWSCPRPVKNRRMTRTQDAVVKMTDDATGVDTFATGQYWQYPRLQ